MFDPVEKSFDVPALESAVLEFWDRNDIRRKYLTKNQDATERFSFIDGPITANGPMGVHHAWGRTYKDLWQRYNTMLGKAQRYQNGFDCQGLWVEVVAERELGFRSKRDIETFGIAEFVRRCKESVFYFADMQTRQSKRLGYFMDWENSYYTLSDENNYTIWHFLKVCNERGLLYRGHDVMPWCTRCGTGISDAEAAEGYQDLTHTSIYVRFPLLESPGEALLVWTTTPWTLTSNVAVAVNPELTYLRVRQGDAVYYLAKGAVGALRGEREVLEELPGAALVGRQYSGPFDDLPAGAGVEHRVIPWAEVSEDEGTGLVHLAPGCGKEDFALSKEFGLPVVAPIDQNGVYGPDFGWLTGRNVLHVGADIVEDLHGRGLLYRTEEYRHRYPTCWRCGTELVFRLVDEWFISMGPLREAMMDVVRQVRWIPAYGLDREIDWLRNMGDWMISKKRYWGLALPFWICPHDHLNVVGGKQELFERALGGIQDLESPHRPWVDEITIACSQCGETARRIPDVGNPWLDAGIVPYSTLHYLEDRPYWEVWFPAQFITESFPGQFRNWFYSLLAMSTVLENTAPFLTVLGYALLRDQNGREMHKSWGNTIPFDEAADRAGADTMRWLFCGHNPESNLNFGWESLDDVKRRLLVLWNTYSFFVTYAKVDGWEPGHSPPIGERSLLDRWILARLNQTIEEVRAGLDAYDAVGPSRSIQGLVEDLSTWYVRRSRRRFWRAENDADKAAAYATLYECLTTLAHLMAPFMPFVSEAIYQNLARSPNRQAPESVHLADYPVADPAAIDDELLQAMTVAQQVVSLGRAAREKAGVMVRQPLATMSVRVPSESLRFVDSMRDIILEELNVRELRIAGEDEEFLTYTVRPNLPVLGPRFGKLLPLIRHRLDELEPNDVARKVSSGSAVTLDVDGQRLELQSEDILLHAEQREGYAAIASDGYLVALDTRLTDALVSEGMARQVVRRLNDYRKSMGLNVEDRISVRYSASSRLDEAMRLHADYIQQETLAVSLTEGEPGGADAVFTSDIGDNWLQVGIRRADGADLDGSAAGA